jgi:hypothetical protein
LKPAEPLEGHDAAFDDGLRGAIERLGAAGQVMARGIEQFELRPARGAGDRLGMEAAVRRVAVFGLAGRAHRKRGHRGPRPVIG